MDLINFYNDHFQAGKISTDSRNIEPGDIFVALRGENFDGNQYAAKALEAGAKIAVVEESPDPENLSYYQVGDTLLFLQKLANHHRKQLQLHVIGLTGSNGKTTTKELLSSILREKYRIHSTAGNLNNHIGVPLTLLSANTDAEICIVEMGANHPGEIEALCKIAEPDSGLITNIGLAHIEGFGDFEGVRKTKAELFDFLKTNHGKIYFNASDSVLVELVDDYKDCVRYNSENELRSEIRSMLP